MRQRSMTPRISARRCQPLTLCWLGGLIAVLSLSGCTTLTEYVHNGFKVGPNYGRPPVPVAQRWIDEGDVRLRTNQEEQTRWWSVFHDPVLDSLVCQMYQ